MEVCVCVGTWGFSGVSVNDGFNFGGDWDLFVF